MNIKQKIAKNTSISFLGKVISSLIGLVSIAFIARELGPEGFGNYNIAIAFLYIFSVFADFGLYNLLTREISAPEANEKDIVSNIFMSRLILLAFFYTLSFIAVYFIPTYSHELKNGIIIASLGFVFLSLSQVIMGVFQKYLQTVFPAVADISARVVQLILVIYLYYKGADFIDFLWVFVLGSFVNFILVYFFAKRYVDFKISFSKKKLFAILKEGWPLAVSLVLVLIYFKGDTLILSFLKESKDVGVYNMAYKVLENIIFFPTMFVGLIMPLLSNYFISDINSFKKVFQKAFDFLNIISIPAVFGGLYLSSGIINLIAGGGFGDSVLAFQILICALFFIFLGALFGNAILAANKQKQAIFCYGAAAVFNIAANLYFIRQYSYIGASFITVATEALVTSLMFAIIYKEIRYIPNLRVTFKAVIASLIMASALYISPIQEFFFLFALGILVYFTAMYLIKGITKEEFTLFFKT